MPLKFHSIVACAIILALFLGWQGIRYFAPRAAAVADAAAPGNAIHIIRASWGLNCGHDAAGAMRTFADDRESNKIIENNILQTIQRFCDGKAACTLHNTVEFMGTDPAPACPNKEMAIEYRCYSFDRPWHLTLPFQASGTADCTNVEPPR